MDLTIVQPGHVLIIWRGGEGEFTTPLPRGLLRIERTNVNQVFIYITFYKLLRMKLQFLKTPHPLKTRGYHLDLCAQPHVFIFSI